MNLLRQCVIHVIKIEFRLRTYDVTVELDELGYGYGYPNFEQSNWQMEQILIGWTCIAGWCFKRHLDNSPLSIKPKSFKVLHPSCKLISLFGFFTCYTLILNIKFNFFLLQTIIEVLQLIITMLVLGYFKIGEFQ